MASAPPPRADAPLAPAILPGRRAGWVLSALALACIAWRVLAIGAGWQDWQWDFRVCHLAAQAWLLGEDPYDLATLRSLATEQVNLRFLYAPSFLLAMAPLGHLDEAPAKALWLALKVLALAGMATLWLRTIVARGERHWLGPFALLAFNGTILADLHTGNAALLEQALLWLAFWFYLRGKGLPLGVLVGVVASLKLAPLVFLLLLADRSVRQRLAGAAAGLAVFGALVGWPMVLDRPLFDAWRASVAVMDENRGLFNPSAWSLAKDVADAAGAGRWLAVALHGLVAAGVAAALLVVARAARKRGEEGRKRLLVAAILAYAVAAPRMKDYGWAFVIPAAYVAFARWKGGAWALLLVVAAMSVDYRYVPGAREAARLAWQYQSWLVAAAALGLACESCLRAGAFPLPPGAGDAGNATIQLDRE